ncbi:MAG: tRNA uracil 4-sulfurtransferase ThiI [Saccharofermentanales bacterium]|jgi:thiamine biosynthesis protein ThiI|nr:tRNA 4-thiouridine(8) synthase ThiI [Clostridiaceae bacterium]
MFDHQEIILARFGEIALKGLNRGQFERRLIGNIKRRLQPLGRFAIELRQSRIWIEPVEEIADFEPILAAVTSVFGIVSASPVWRFGAEQRDDLQVLKTKAVEFIEQLIKEGGSFSFKVESRRSDKRYPLTSPEINILLGGHLLQTFPDQLRVDVHQPDFVLYVEVREQLYIYSRVVKGHKGLPVGTGGQGMLLLSGGIDSPVAGYMMASRGMELQAVYFHAFPFTGDQAKEKVIELAKQLAVYAGRLRLHIVNFTDIQLILRDHCPQDMLTIAMRRMMMRIAARIAKANGCRALITGESLGQVASQTLEALCTTDVVSPIPVFRPLIGLDKDDITQIARRIGTYETSILPYEDCCTVFVAKHPKTKPTLADAEIAEEGLDIDRLVEDGLVDLEEVRL